MHNAALPALAATALLLGPAMTPPPVGATNAATTVPGQAAFAPYQQPTDRYARGSCLIDLSKIEDYTDRRKVGGCGTHITLSTTFVKLSVPHTWRTWSCPPDSETCKPDLLYSDHGTTAATIDFGTTVTTGGFALEPAYDHQPATVDFYTGPLGSGTLVGTITRDVDSNAGARLFAAKAKPGFRSAIVTTNPDGDFGIAQIRV